MIQSQYPLHNAVKNNDLESVIKLLANNCDVNAYNDKDETALHLAQHYTIIKMLLAAGADIHALSGKDTPLISMIVRRYVPGVQLLLQAGANVNQKHNSYYNTALHLAVSQWFENIAIIKLLLEAGADVHAQDNDGSTPLYIAIDHMQSHAIIRLLQNHGADINAQDNNGDTPLKNIIQKAHKDILKDQNFYKKMIKFLKKQGAHL